MKLFLLLAAFAAIATADQVALKNGDKISGKIVKSDAKSLLLKTEYAGEVTISRASIESVTSDDPVHVQLQSETVVGQVTPAGEGTLEIKPATGPVTRTELKDVQAFRSAAEQQAWEREQERLLRPRLNDFWAGFISLNFAGATGNAQTSSFATSAAATREAGKNKMGLYFNQVYATQSNVAPSGATANRVSGGFRIDRDVNGKTFVFATTDFDSDRFLDLDLRSVFGGGFGYHVWKSPRGFFDVNGGGVHNREKFGTGLIRNSGEVLIGEESSHRLMAALKVYQKAIFYPNLTARGEYRFNFDGGASIPVMKWLEWNVGISNRFLSNPIAGKKSNDMLYTTGIRFSFDQTRR